MPNVTTSAQNFIDKADLVKHIGYMVQDRETGDFDWDEVLHETINDAVKSLTSSMYNPMHSDLEESPRDGSVLWYTAYRICPILACM